MLFRSTSRRGNRGNPTRRSRRSISKAMEEGAAGITGVADSTRKMEKDMTDITKKMDINQDIVEELKKQMEMFVDL